MDEAFASSSAESAERFPMTPSDPLLKPRLRAYLRSEEDQKEVCRIDVTLDLIKRFPEYSLDLATFRRNLDGAYAEVLKEEEEVLGCTGHDLEEIAVDEVTGEYQLLTGFRLEFHWLDRLIIPPRVCGGCCLKGHPTLDCPALRGVMAACEYCDEYGHLVRACHKMHNLCHKCLCRGHWHGACNQKDEAKWLRFKAQGVLTASDKFTFKVDKDHIVEEMRQKLGPEELSHHVRAMPAYLWGWCRARKWNLVKSEGVARFVQLDWGNVFLVRAHARCDRCFGRDHGRDECPHRATQLRCAYCGVANKHLVTACVMLHNTCLVCLRRGHSTGHCHRDDAHNWAAHKRLGGFSSADRFVYSVRKAYFVRDLRNDLGESFQRLLPLMPAFLQNWFNRDAEGLLDLVPPDDEEQHADHDNEAASESFPLQTAVRTATASVRDAMSTVASGKAKAIQQKVKGIEASPVSADSASESDPKLLSKGIVSANPHWHVGLVFAFKQCTCCGRMGHKKVQCPLKHVAVCHYCGVAQRHLIEVCPLLHVMCKTCLRRGHSAGNCAKATGNKKRWMMLKHSGLMSSFPKFKYTVNKATVVKEVRTALGRGLLADHVPKHIQQWMQEAEAAKRSSAQTKSDAANKKRLAGVGNVKTADEAAAGSGAEKTAASKQEGHIAYDATKFATARAFYDHLLAENRARGLDPEAAEAEAARMLKKEAGAMLEPQWRMHPRFPCCSRCGSDGHRAGECEAAPDTLTCDYCGAANSHSVAVCRMLHQLCFRCERYGHKIQNDPNMRCVGQDKDEDWVRCKPKGYYTRLPEFELMPRWDVMAEQVKAKFEGFMSLVTSHASPIVRYTLERSANPQCQAPWTWYKHDSEPPKFATAKEFFDHHLGSFIGQGMDEEEAKKQAMIKYQQEAVASLVEPQWREKPRFTCCHKCGSGDHKGKNCDQAGSDLRCEYCGATNHATAVCFLLHSFCFRCGCFGHATKNNPNIPCVEHDKDEDWRRCKPLGVFTHLPEFEFVPRWDVVEKRVKAKFKGFMDQTRPILPPLARYAVDKKAINSSWNAPWAWYKKYTEKQAQLLEAKKTTAKDLGKNNDVSKAKNLPSKKTAAKHSLDAVPEDKLTFATARELFEHHVNALLAQGLDAEAAEKTAKPRYQRDVVSALVEPQWRGTVRFPCCHKCGLDGHRSGECDQTLAECEYCGRTNHSVVACTVLHRFCFRCERFGHVMQADPNEQCIGQSRDEDWKRCKPKGYYTRLPEFELVPRWDVVAEQVKAKFEGFLDLTRHYFPNFVHYALERDSNPECETPWVWFKRYKASTEGKTSKNNKTRARVEVHKADVASKRSRLEEQIRDDYSSSVSKRAFPAPKPKPPMPISTARARFDAHLQSLLDRGVEAETAKQQAVARDGQGASTLLAAPQWRMHARFSGCCGKCGSGGHTRPTCRKADDDLACDYCGLAGHVVAVCELLHRFCFRCERFGHTMQADPEKSCVGHSRDDDWKRCKPKGLFTRLPEFELVPRWDVVAEQAKAKYKAFLGVAMPSQKAKAKFEAFVALTRHYLPPIVLYSLEKDSNPDCESPWAWFRQSQSNRCGGDSKKKKKSETKKRGHPDDEGNAEAISKRSRREEEVTGGRDPANQDLVRRDLRDWSVQSAGGGHSDRLSQAQSDASSSFSVGNSYVAPAINDVAAGIDDRWDSDSSEDGLDEPTEENETKKIISEHQHWYPQLRLDTAKLCRCCGHRRHSSDPRTKCPVLDLAVCEYCGAKGSHLVETCPLLHRLCLKCWRRGHDTDRCDKADEARWNSLKTRGIASKSEAFVYAVDRRAVAKEISEAYGASLQPGHFPRYISQFLKTDGSSTTSQAGEEARESDPGAGDPTTSSSAYDVVTSSVEVCSSSIGVSESSVDTATVAGCSSTDDVDADSAKDPSSIGDADPA